MEKKHLTVKELIDALTLCDPNATIEFEYDGPDTYTYKTAGGFFIDDDLKRIVIVEGTE